MPWASLKQKHLSGQDCLPTQKQSKSWSGAGTTGRWLRVQHLAQAVAVGLGEMSDIFSMGTMDHGLACFLEQPERIFSDLIKAKWCGWQMSSDFCPCPFFCPLLLLQQLWIFKATLFVLCPVNCRNS